MKNSTNSKNTLFVCAGNNEIWDFATPIGIGLVSSAINLTRILAKNSSYEKLVFVGTCGLYEKGEILGILESDNAVNIEISALLGLSYSPIVSCETSLINSSNFITTDRKIALEFSKRGILAENMEFYSVCEVAKSFRIPVSGVFCATNFCDKNAHADFLKNHKKAMEILGNYINENYFRF